MIEWKYRASPVSAIRYSMTISLFFFFERRESEMHTEAEKEEERVDLKAKNTRDEEVG